jgi:hypothetical protein
MKFKIKKAKHSQYEYRHDPKSRKADKHGRVRYLKTYTAGQVVESKHDLVKKFGDTKFKRVPDETPATKSGRPPKNEPLPAKVVADSDAEDDDEFAEDPDGAGTVPEKGKARPGEGDEVTEVDMDEEEPDLTEVTDEFDGAPDANVSVHRGVDGFWVSDNEEPEEFINDEPLKRAAVRELIAERTKPKPAKKKAVKKRG